MPKGKKYGGRDFQPGHKFSKGRPKLPDEFKAAQLLTKDQLKNLISKYIFMTPNELQALSEKQQEMRAVDLIIIGFIGAALKGDHYKAEWLIQRSAGKVTEEQDTQPEQSAHSKLIEYIKERQQDS